MIIDTGLAYVAGALACVLGVSAVVRKRRALASWCFLVGMAALAVESVSGVLAGHSENAAKADDLLTLSLVAKAILPGVWLCFSLTYCRGNAREFLGRWRVALLLAIVVPLGIAFGGREGLVQVVSSDSADSAWLEFGRGARALSVVLLIAALLILINLEKTFRTAVGTERWRIKYLFLGAALIFGARVYTVSQALLFSGFNPAMNTVETAALFIGGILMSIGYLRKAFGDLDLYPSHVVLRGSLTVILAGSYLIVVGILAQVVASLGGAESFPGQAFLLLVGSVGLAVLLLSDRFRTGVRRFVARHFRRPQYNFRQVWMRFTERTFNVLDPEGLCRVSAELISETFDILTVTIFLIDEDERKIQPGATTFQRPEGDGDISATGEVGRDIIERFRLESGLVDLDAAEGQWANALREASPVEFGHGGHRFAMPLVTGDRLLGVAVLADRVGGTPYTQEERDLLGCISDQVAAALLNRRLTGEVMQSKEVEAFQTIATFFVHDLKNAANSLSLMLQNLPTHFDDPEFRKDALRGIGKTVDRINSLIEKLGAFRNKLEIEPVDSDFNGLVDEVLENLNGSMDEVQLVRERHELPKVALDPEQMRSVVTNLVVNAREAVEAGGRIEVRTSESDGRAVLVVSDDGCGMSPEFVKDSLFRPFCSTKSKGLGIGIFQAKLIVEAHQGTMQVESELEKGTTFRVSLPSGTIKNK